MSSRALKPPSTGLYDKDFFAWTMETARLLRAGLLSEVDIEHVAEEIEDMGKSERREVASRMRIILLHLLKWKWQPEKRSPSWQSTLATQRAELRDAFHDSPSLRRAVGAIVPKVYRDAVRAASIETELPVGAFPGQCPFTPDQVLNEDFLPE
jgi:uncharacterized protein DUF29